VALGLLDDDPVAAAEHLAPVYRLYRRHIDHFRSAPLSAD
jgi:hypothetical protein